MKARIDTDGTAEPKTRLVAHVPEGTCVVGTPADTIVDTATGERMALHADLSKCIPLHPNEWEDQRDEWTDKINEAHPTRSGSHDEYATAMQMVGHRHSKGALVELVNWLLVKLRPAECTHPLESIEQQCHEGRCLQVCSDCGSRRWLPGLGWRKPRVDE